MAGVEIYTPCDGVVSAMIEKDVLVNCTNESVIRLLPPYVISQPDIDMFAAKFEEVLISIK
jgi:acetylornithine/N-succinyldiaminopimelate aminotransferase